MAEKFNARKTNLEDYLKSSKNKSYFIVAVTVLFLVIFLILGVIPAYGAILDQVKQNKARDEAIAKLETKIETLENLKEEREEKTDLVSFLEKAIPNGNNQEAVIEKVYSIAERTGVIVTLTTFPLEENKKPLSDIFQATAQIEYASLTVTVEGSNLAVLDFARELEDSRIIFNVDNVIVTKKSADELEQNGERGDYVMRLNLKYFYFKEVEEV